MLFHISYLIATLLGLFLSPASVAARFCEGGHICSLPRECCTQGCCPPYQSGPRQLPPATDHVLNLFFISHWYFWCVVVAIILAILCAYSLWKKRRTLCGWGFTENHAQSEGDSAGSCYAPPQYSRCSSFHHPPPPYTEVTSKPDLYPLVFTCNSDNGKNGASYLMVQYFRNYIVRPAGSLSATSTVDSLSSSFICNANEANTLVPPPYSRAASPEIGISSHFQQHYMIPRSASQVVCSSENAAHQLQRNSTALSGRSSGVYNHQMQHEVSSTSGGGGGGVGGGNGDDGIVGAGLNQYSTSHMRTSESVNFQNINSGCSSSSSGNGSGPGSDREQNTGFISSHSDQHFCYMANSNSSLSDIFVNNSCMAGIGIGSNSGSSGLSPSAGGSVTTATTANNPQTSLQQQAQTTNARSGGMISIVGNGLSAQSNGTLASAKMNHPLHRASTNPTQFNDTTSCSTRSSIPMYNSCNSIGGISITVPVATDGETEYRDLDMLRRSLETCCQILQQQKQMPPPPASSNFNSEVNSPVAANGVGSESAGTVGDLVVNSKKYDDGQRSYVTSTTCSAVSSLANIGTPTSPPQATSPTGEVKEILDQIRQLHAGASFDENVLRHHSNNNHSRHYQQQQLSSCDESGGKGRLQRFPTMPEHSTYPTAIANINGTASLPVVPATATTTTPLNSTKRPSTLQQSKKKFFSKPNKAMYIPMMSNSGNFQPRCSSMIKSPVSGTNFLNRGRTRKGWISRSAPTTPGTGLPPNHLSDDSPLLNEHDEDQEAEQNA